jgi:DNA-binding NtrC family response regulator
MSSTNGTWVNGVSIMEALLRGGEHVRVGDNVLLVERDPAKESEVLPRRTSFGRVIGASREMRRVYGLCEPLAASTIPVVIEGETGTGKEALAEALHETGPRASGPFVVFDCTAVPSTLMEAELFGHERGAFTGATNKHAGVLEQAHGGTLLIDEIGDLDLALQPKLLRALERGEYRRIGGERSMRVDVRVIAATRRNLDREVEAGRFRDDLYHRMAVCRIELPPLRHRRGDVPTLAKAFCHDLGGDAARIPAHLIAKWDDYSWPGNVRELRNAVIRYLALGEKLSGTMHSTSAISMPSERDPLHDVATVAQRVISEGLPLVVARRMVVEAFEQRYLEATLARHGGVVTHAAAASGIARRHFQRLRARPR